MNAVKLTEFEVGAVGVWRGIKAWDEGKHPRDDRGRFGSSSAVDILARPNPKEIAGVAKLRDKLRIQNDGIGSTYDVNGFHDKVLLPLHNRGDVRSLVEFANKNPDKMKKLKRAMHFDLWLDSHSTLSFQDFEKSSIVIFRGVQPSANREGVSWTTSKEIAKTMSREGASNIGWRIPGKRGKVISKKVNVSDVLLYSNQQGEHEIILQSILGKL